MVSVVVFLMEEFREISDSSSHEARTVQGKRKYAPESELRGSGPGEIPELSASFYASEKMQTEREYRQGQTANCHITEKVFSI